MSTKTFVIFAIVSCVFFPITKIVGEPVPTPSILTEINNNEQVCKTKSVFSESRYVKSCQRVAFLIDKNETLDESKNGKFLCLGLYQKIWDICYLDSTSKATNKTLPHTAALFDSRVEKSYLNNSVNVLTFCQNMTFPITSAYQKIQPYVSQLNAVLRTPVLCVKMCSTWQGQFEPLCAVLATMDQISLELKAATKQSAGTETEGHSQNAEAKGSAVADPARSEPEPPVVTPRNTTANGYPSVTNVAEAAPQSSVQLVQSKEQIKANSTKETKSQKPETAQTAGAKNQKDPKGVSTGEGKEDKTQQTIPHPAIVQKKDKTDAEPIAAKNNNDNPPPQAAEGQARANSQEDIDKNPTGIEQEEEDVDVISQHTQDDDITLDRRPSEDVNEIESPIIPTLEEDVNENPPQAPEKSSFVPHLPGLREDDDSHFFGYFTVIGVICLAGYVGYHNKQKIFAMVLEGRRSRGGRGKRRPSTANYRKLDCTLEEAVTSQCNSNVTHVIY